MKLEHRFQLKPDAATVWESFKDSCLMAECLPGAELENMADPDQLEGRLTVKLGPIVAGFDGKVNMARDDAAQTGTMNAQGRDRRTGTQVRAVITYSVAELESGTEVTLASDVSLMGNLAQFARQGLIDRIANDLVAQFASNLEARLTEKLA